jgi:eukaryotic-like serine/threonine-protein kinase
MGVNGDVLCGLGFSRRGSRAARDWQLPAIWPRLIRATYLTQVLPQPSSEPHLLADLREHLKSTLGSAYTLGRELGGGGMSRVFVATEAALGRQIVVKVLPPDLAGGVNVERFRREIQLAAQLVHPHVIPLLSAGESDGIPYYTMPFIEGESLRAKLTRAGALDVEEAVHIAREVAGALDYAHRVGVVHRDIKPENILLQDGHALVADFGIARAVRQAATVSTLTMIGMALGTPAYMSPEQAMGEREIDGRADVYSLGCVLYEMLTGTLPYDGATAQAVIARHMMEPIPSARTRRADVPPAISAAVTTALAKEPDGRFESAASFARALRAGAHPTTTEMPTPLAIASPVRPRERSLVVIPFANLSPDPDNAYFAEGLTEEIITDLSSVDGLRVISRASAMRLRDPTRSLGSIARELDVTYALTGSVRRAGDRLRIAAQLVDATRDKQLWADKYDGTVADVFAIQATVATAIVDSLRIQLTPGTERRIAENSAMDLRAYECLLKARHELWSFSPGSLERALQLVRGASVIVGENEHLLAMEGLIYWQYVNYLIAPAEEFDVYLRRAEDCVVRVFELNPASPRGFALRGSIRNHRADPVGAWRDFKRAVELDPTNPESLFWLGYASAVTGRPEVGRPLVDKLLSVDPLTPLNYFCPAWLSLMEGKAAEAIQPARRGCELDPSSVPNRWTYGVVLAANGSSAEACALFDATRRDASPDDKFARLAGLQALGMRRDRLALDREATTDILAAAWSDDLCALIVTWSYAAAGVVDEALRWLERVIDLGIVNHTFFARHDPFLGPVRTDVRFGALMDRARRLSAELGD